VNIEVTGTEENRHVGIGIVDKSFNFEPGNWIGQDAFSYGTWDNCIGIYNTGSGTLRPGSPKLKEGDVVTIDLDLDEGVLNWAVNGFYFNEEGVFRLEKKEYAIAASLWQVRNKVSIIQSLKYL